MSIIPGTIAVFSLKRSVKYFFPNKIPTFKSNRFSIPTSNRVSKIIGIEERDTTNPTANESTAKAKPNKTASRVSIIPEVSKSTPEGSRIMFMAIPKELMLIIAIDTGSCVSFLGYLQFNQPCIIYQRPIIKRIKAPTTFVKKAGKSRDKMFPAKNPMLSKHIEMMSRIKMDFNGTFIFFIP